MLGLLDCLPWKEPKPISGTVVLMTKKVLGLSDFYPSLLDKGHELLGDHDGISFQLVSSTIVDPSTGKAKLGKETNLESQKITLTSLAAGELIYNTEFEWDTKLGIPGAVIVKNHHHSEFFLKTVTVEDLPKKGKVHFVCNSWVYPKYPYDRVFFSNDTYLPNKMPAPLKAYRDQELVHLRGDDVAGDEELKEWDRVYDYATYNDLSNPAKAEQVRPILGGPEHPYPRRGRTSRPNTEEDEMLESRVSLANSLHIYVPCDERFGHLKMSDFLADSVKSIEQALFPAMHSIFDPTPNEFDSFKDTLNLYDIDGGIPLPHPGFVEKLRKAIPFEFIKEWTRTDGTHAFRLPLPDVLEKDKLAWGSDEEFGREMLAGVNPVLIRRLDSKDFPPSSQLDKSVYGDQTSTITADHIEKNLERLSVHEALKANRLFILDHHDHFIPYLPRINALKGNYIYATRTLLFLKDDGTLKPVAIELSRVHEDEHGPRSEVYTPPASASKKDVELYIWQLAKAYVAVNDSGFHQLISHWLNTHAVIEPFIIATHRQLSVMHPIHKLMSPHYRDTMNINALARQTLINAGGIFERTVFPQKYALTMSSDVYRSWNLYEQGLPADLIKRLPTNYGGI